MTALGRLLFLPVFEAPMQDRGPLPWRCATWNSVMRKVDGPDQKEIQFESKNEQRSRKEEKVVKPFSIR